MTDQLRDVLTRIAERAEPAGLRPDPVVTGASRSPASRRCVDRLRRRRSPCSPWPPPSASSVQPDPGPTRPVADRTRDPASRDRPRRGRRRRTSSSRPTSPSGPASVAIANPTGAFVVTAEDGVYHRLDLPGFDPAVYDDPEVRRPAWSGSACRRTGRRLAYGWHAPLPDETGQEHGFVPSGVRILDLGTGGSRTVPEDRQPRASSRTAIAEPGLPVGPGPLRAALVTRTAATSPTSWCGRPLAPRAARPSTGATASTRPTTTPTWPPASRSTTPPRVDGFDPEETRLDPTPRFWLSDALGGTAGRRWCPTTAPSREWTVNNTLDAGAAGATHRDRRWTSRRGRRRRPHRRSLRRSPAGSILETRAPSSHLLAVDLRTGRAPEARGWTSTPCTIDLLGVDRPTTTCWPRCTAPRVLARGPRRGT